MRYQLKLWDSKREKINRPEHIVGRSQNKGTKQVQRRARRLRTGPAPLETGGWGGGERGRLTPRTASPTALQTGLQFLIKDLLRLWMVDILREGGVETQGAGTRPARAGTGAGDAEGRRRTHLGRVCPSSSWLPEPL